MISPNKVFEAVRRGYSELETSSEADIMAYFSNIETENAMGHVNHMKGILFESEYVEKLTEQGIHAAMYEATNHPVSDIAVFLEDDVVSQLQLKATDSTSYVLSAIEENPNVNFVVTSEVANQLNIDWVTDSGISNMLLEESVTDTLFEETVNPINPLSVIGWLIGLPFWVNT